MCLHIQLYIHYTHIMYTLLTIGKGEKKSRGKKPHVFTAIAQPLRVESMFLLLLNYNYSPREF